MVIEDIAVLLRIGMPILFGFPDIRMRIRNLAVAKSAPSSIISVQNKCLMFSSSIGTSWPAYLRHVRLRYSVLSPLWVARWIDRNLQPSWSLVSLWRDSERYRGPYHLTEWVSCSWFLSCPSAYHSLASFGLACACFKVDITDQEST